MRYCVRETLLRNVPKALQLRINLSTPMQGDITHQNWPRLKELAPFYTEPRILFDEIFLAAHDTAFLFRRRRSNYYIGK